MVKSKLIQGDIRDFKLPLLISLIYAVLLFLLIVDKVEFKASLLTFFTTFMLTFQFSSFIIKRTYLILPDIYGGKVLGWFFAALYFIGLASMTYAVFMTTFGV